MMRRRHLPRAREPSPGPHVHFPGVGPERLMMKQVMYWTLAIPLTAIAALVVLKLMQLAI